jgi:hypothetical protein
VSFGLSIEMYQRAQVWEKLEEHLTDSMLPSDLSAYPIDEPIRELEADKRSAEALATALKPFVEHWPIPSVSVWPSNRKQEQSGAARNDNAEFFTGRIDSLRKQAGMQAHQIVSVGIFDSDEPEEILERIFTFFEVNPEVPALLVFATDGDLTRKLVGDISRKEYWEDGPRRFRSMATTVVALVLARRERVDAYLRPFAGSRATHLYPAGLAKPGFNPSKYLPQAWTAEQLDQFDALPTIAAVHRPIRVCYREKQDGKTSINGRQQVRIVPLQMRHAAFKEGVDTALQSIPGGKPSRVFFDTGDCETGGHIAPLSLAAHDSLPSLELTDPEVAIDFSRRIGNTGACSPVVMWALAALTAFKKEEASIAVHLRQREEATITVVTPIEKRPQAEPIRPAAPAPTPVKVAPPKAVRPPAPRNVVLGARLRSGDECTQTGMWRCAPADMNAGDTHFLLAGRTLPDVSVAKKTGMWQKIFRAQTWGKVAAEWTLVSYDEPAYS